MPSKQIRKIEEELSKPRDWKYTGEARACHRPHNSLLSSNLEFDSALFNIPISATENASITKYIAQRFREKTFDNYEFKERKLEIKEEEYDTTLLESSKEIIKLYETIENEINRMTDYRNDQF